MNIVRSLRHYLLLLTAAMFSCSLEPLTGGSDMPNGILITGTVCDEGGAESPGTEVRIIPVDYDPVNDLPLPESYATTTDIRGRYTVRVPNAGWYNILAIQRERRTRALLLAVAASGETVSAPHATLKKPGALKVALSGANNIGNGYVYIPGTTIASSLADTGGFVILDSVPAGIIPGIYYRQKSDSAAPVKIADSVSVPSGGAFTVAYGAWKFSKRFSLNTTASGADVPATVTGFPLLVRLASSTFSFGEARPDGADLRFTKSNGTPLPYEIERWDPVTGLAEVWVKVDTVYGNNDSQNIVMYWGNPGAISISNSARAFDTANGFACVWHLGENSDSMYDATGNGFNGKKYGSTAAPGMIGNAEYFANGKYIRIPGLLNRPSNVTLSAWVRSDTSAGRGQDIVSIGDAVLIRFDDVKGLGTGGSYHNNPAVNDSMYGRVCSGRYLAKTGWHYLAFSINSTSHVQTLYIDGVKSVNTQDVNPIYYAGLGTDTYIGMHGNGKTGFNFIGQIDEVRVNNNALAPDWVKLCFMNQKEQDALILW
jgi:hypothetical protein